jgi:hypothetical protein
MGEKRKVYSGLMGMSKGKRPLGRLRCRWDDGIKMDLVVFGWGEVDSPVSAKDLLSAVVNMVMNLWVLAPWSELVKLVIYSPLKLGIFVL